MRETAKETVVEELAESPGSRHAATDTRKTSSTGRLPSRRKAVLIGSVLQGLGVVSVLAIKKMRSSSDQTSAGDTERNISTSTHPPGDDGTPVDGEKKGTGPADDSTESDESATLTDTPTDDISTSDGSPEPRDDGSTDKGVDTHQSSD